MCNVSTLLALFPGPYDSTYDGATNRDDKSNWVCYYRGIGSVDARPVCRELDLEVGVADGTTFTGANISKVRDETIDSLGHLEWKRVCVRHAFSGCGPMEFGLRCAGKKEALNNPNENL